LHLALIIATVFLVSAPAFLFNPFSLAPRPGTRDQHAAARGGRFAHDFRCYGWREKYRELQKELLPDRLRPKRLRLLRGMGFWAHLREGD
jgi:hypothetical protein